MLPLLARRFETVDLELAGGELTVDQMGTIGTMAALLTEVGADTSALCVACGDPHVGEVEVRHDPASGIHHAFVRCPHLIRTPIRRERLLRWQIRPDAVAAAIAHAMGTTGTPQVDVADRVWFLGRATMGRRSFAVFLARGLTWPDAASILGAARLLLASKSPLVVVPGMAPADHFWQGRVPDVLSLLSVAAWGDEGVVIDRDHLAATYGLTPQQRAAPISTSFPTPPQSTWQDVHLTLAPDGQQDRVVVTITGRKQVFTFQEAGFSDGRSQGQRPNQNWAMLRAFAGEGGVIAVNSTALRSKERTKQAIHAFREALQRWIPDVVGSPIEHDPVRNAYVCAFHIGSAQETRFPLPASVTTWDDIAIGVRADGIVVAAATGIRRRIVAWAASDEGDVQPTTTTGVVPGTISHVYSHASLGLLDDHDRPTPAVTALAALVQHHGTATGAVDHPGFLALGGILTRLVGIRATPPLEFQPPGRSRQGDPGGQASQWIAQFEIIPRR